MGHLMIMRDPTLRLLVRICTEIRLQFYSQQGGSEPGLDNKFCRLMEELHRSGWRPPQYKQHSSDNQDAEILSVNLARPSRLNFEAESLLHSFHASLRSLYQRENGCITILFCSFNAALRIQRVFFTGCIIESSNPDFQPYLERMRGKGLIGARAVIRLDVFRVFPPPVFPEITDKVTRYKPHAATAFHSYHCPSTHIKTLRIHTSRIERR